MNSNRLLEQCFGTPHLGEVSGNDLSQLIRRYPYYAPARWWMAAKEAPEEQKGRLRQAAAFCYYPLRLAAYIDESFPEFRKALAEMEVEADWTKAGNAADIEAATRKTMAAAEVIDPQIPSVMTEKSDEDASFQEAAEKDIQVTKDEITTTAEPESAGKPSSNELLIQPLYTEDYFAYAGVKLPENLTDDKRPTMAQLLSFTDWLRTLKRPGGSIDPDLEPDEIESARLAQERLSSPIRSFARASLQNQEEVVTESMAEVRVRQGQISKAIHIYEKLLLLNPEKNSYFAAKAEELKNKSNSC